MAALVGLLRFEIETYMVLMANRAAIHENLPVRPSTIKRPKPLIKMSSWADNGKVEYEPRSIETGVRKLVAMKCVKKFGIVVGAVAMLAMCRPASATELMFSFTAATLETIFSSTPGFGAGACGAASQVTTLCGIYQISLIPTAATAANASLVSIGSPIPSGTDAWDDAAETSSNVGCAFNAAGCDQAYWYAGFTASGNPVTLLTENGNVGNPSSLFSLYNGATNALVTGLNSTTYMPLSDAFTFAFNTTSTVTASQVVFDLGVELVPINANGTFQSVSKEEWYTETSFTTPEPSGAWLCLLGAAVVGVSRKRRWLVARWDRRI